MSIAQYTTDELLAELTRRNDSMNRTPEWMPRPDCGWVWVPDGCAVHTSPPLGMIKA